MAITDHAEYWGLWPEIMKPGGLFSAPDIARELFSGDQARAKADGSKGAGKSDRLKSQGVSADKVSPDY